MSTPVSTGRASPLAASATSAPPAESSPYILGFRSERFFLLVAVFIGILSGLAVVWFRITIEWIRLELLGSSLAPSPARALLAPSSAARLRPP